MVLTANAGTDVYLTLSIYTLIIRIGSGYNNAKGVNKETARFITFGRRFFSGAREVVIGFTLLYYS